MAPMDRKYHRVNSELTALRKDVGSLRRGLFADQVQRADTIRRFDLGQGYRLAEPGDASTVGPLLSLRVADLVNLQHNDESAA